jgi:hypothetical protein
VNGQSVKNILKEIKVTGGTSGNKKKLKKRYRKRNSRNVIKTKNQSNNIITER